MPLAQAFRFPTDLCYISVETMRFVTAFLRTCALSGLLAVGVDCGSGDGNGGAEGGKAQLDDRKLLRDLSDAELGALCDEIAAAEGGYGKVTATCDAGFYTRSSPNREACMASVKRTNQCTATVGNVRDCQAVRRQQACNLSAVYGSPPCVPLRTCG